MDKTSEGVGMWSFRRYDNVEVLKGSCDSDRLGRLEQRVRELECSGHRWVEDNDIWRTNFLYKWNLKCSKCGATTAMHFKEWNELQLEYAYEEVVRLGGEVEEVECED